MANNVAKKLRRDGLHVRVLQEGAHKAVFTRPATQ